MTVAAIATPRLVLLSVDVQTIELLLARDEVAAGERLGAVLPDDLGAAAEGLLRVRLNDLRTAPEAQPWLLRVIAERGTPRRMVGLVGFHGPPDAAGRAEIGYEVLPQHRRRGIAAEAVRAMLAWASGQGARTFVASIRPDNAASRGVATHLGFRQAGSRWGPVEETELIFELPADRLTAWELPPRWGA